MISAVIQMAARGAAIVCLPAIFAAPLAFAGAAPRTLWPLWDQYKLQFLKPEGRIVDWDAGARTTSEGQAYALFFSLVADDRPAFDCILAWTETHLAQDSLRNNLPAWLWTPAGAGANAGAVADANSASDADLRIAYTLIQAGRVWRNPDYTALGRSLAERIAREETELLPGKGYMLLPGHDGFRTDSGATILNPSYMPPQLLAALSRELPTGPWHSIANTLPELLSPEIGHGFAMDWVVFRADSGFSATAMPPGSPGGSYDAIRVYLWAGMLHPSAAGRQALLQNLSGMEAYLREHPIPPERVAPSGAVIDANAPVGFSARGHSASGGRPSAVAAGAPAHAPGTKPQPTHRPLWAGAALLRSGAYSLCRGLERGLLLLRSRWPAFRSLEKAMKVLRRILVTLGAAIFLLAAPGAHPQSDSVTLLLQRARAFENRGRIDLAAKLWLQVIQSHPDDYEALEGPSRYSTQTGNSEDARRYSASRMCRPSRCRTPRNRRASSPQSSAPSLSKPAASLPAISRSRP